MTWSHIYSDYSLHKNFNIGFSSHKNDIHIQLSQWQYWWWFWFAAVWALYFFVILRCYLNKNENYNITLNTSMRSHGKWGDFLIASIPLSWCGNILINSNFILRMLEWQNESSLFTIRIQGKQWYWSYKYNSNINLKLNNVYLNVGNNNWLKNQLFTNFFFKNQNTTLHYIFDYEFKKLHKIKLQNNKLKKNYLKFNNLLLNSVGEYSSNSDKHNSNSDKLVNFISKLNYLSRYSLNTSVLLSSVRFNIVENITPKLNCDLTYKNIKIIKTSYFNRRINNYNNLSLFSDNNNKSLFNNFFEVDKLDETFISEDNFRVKNIKFPLKLQLGTLNKNNISLLHNNNTKLFKNIFLNYKINNVDTAQKLSHFEEFWGFRQKRYKKLRSYSFSQNTKYNSNTYAYVKSFLLNKDLNKYNLYNSFKNNKFKHELIPVTLAKRLLRTKRTLVLPVHINLTLITNSYDVVHSWFVPGLGLKIDCVPGRSTHHSLYIDTVGFYYGQCAEICGRYHHHMPIRVCALPYDHFVLWWQTKGLPRMYRSEKFLKSKSILLNKLN